jgi:hypothetical protein
MQMISERVITDQNTQKNDLIVRIVGMSPLQN